MACEAPPVPNMPALLGRPLPENVYGTLTHTFIPRELGRVIPATENYVTHFPVTSKGTKFFLVVTDTKLYKISDTLSKKRDVWDFKDIHSIVGTEENVTINLVSRVGSDEVFVSIQKKNVLFFSLFFSCFFFVDSHVNPKVFEGDAFFCQALPFVFLNRSRIVWQQFIESKFVPEPEIYQCHFFVAYQEAKKKMGACIIFSTLCMYVCTLKSNLPATVKEKIPADKITGLALVPGNDHAIKISMGDISSICVTVDADECNSLFVSKFFY